MTTKATLEGGVATLTLNNPPLNILTRGVLASLRASLAEWADDLSLRVLVLVAEGSNFSAGADVVEHLPPTFTEMIPEFVDTIEALASFGSRSWWRSRGDASAAASSWRLPGTSSSRARARSSAAGNCARRHGAGRLRAAAAADDFGRASEMLLTGDTITAAQAREAGIVQRVVTDDRVQAEALVLARRMARHSAVALRETKRSMRVSADYPRGGTAGDRSDLRRRSDADGGRAGRASRFRR